MNINRLEQTAPWKHELEDHIEQLRELDKLRNRSAELRNKGVMALKNWLMKQKDELDADPIKKAEANLNQANVAIILYHLSRTFDPKLWEKMVEVISKLSELSPIDLEKHHLSVENAAQNLHVLVKSPNAAFSEKALCCFYHVVRELYTTDVPNWSIGGLAAARGGPVSAYMTSLCLHSLFEFAEAQENTAKFLRNIRTFLEQLNVIIAMPGLESWKKTEIERLRHSYYLAFSWQSKSLVLCFESIDPKKELESYVLDRVLVKLVTAIKEIHDSFDRAITKHKDHRKKEIKATALSANKRKKFERSELGHKIACAALLSGIEISKKTLEQLEHNGFDKAINELINIRFLDVIKALGTDSASIQKDTIDSIKTNLAVIIAALKMVESQFEKAAYETRKSRYPAANYLNGVLDHQLAAAESGGNSTWEPYELACAAECLGTMDKQRWGEDKRLAWSAQKLSKIVSDRGMFPFSQPYHSDISSGGQIVPQSTIAHIFSELYRLLPKTSPVKIEIETIQQLIYFFEDTFIKRVPDFLEVSQELEEGWSSEYDPHPRIARPNYTAQAVQALASINDLLDERINSVILDHFTVRQPEDMKLDLDDLFYPDYGLALKEELLPRQEVELEKELKNIIGDNKKNKTQLEILAKKEGWSKIRKREESVAITLQDTRAHVLKTRPKNSSKKSIHSLVLHGPPGTGKTTLVEALAKSCNVPLVEVTPSDIVMGGMEAVERSARTVFEALSFLTRAVILFDEFDPVLWQRDPQAGPPDNVFSFLTPGMLPKLKKLHDKTEERSVVYVLGTNRMGCLDDAAVRKGRFDEKIGIFPPDLLSRKGRLYNQYFAFKLNAMKEKVTTDFPPDNILEQRIDFIVRETKGGPMDILGKPGWFTKPKLEKVLERNKSSISQVELNKTPFGHLIFNAGLDEVEREAEINGIIGEGKTAIKEWMQWHWVSETDKQA